MTSLCSSAPFFMQEYPPLLKCMKVSSVLVKSPTALGDWAALVSGTKKVRLFLPFVIDAAPRLSLDFLWTPADCIVKPALFFF